MNHRSVVDSFRVIVVRRGAERHFTRWRFWDWTTEEKRFDGWNLRRAGVALTRRGARQQALRDAHTASIGINSRVDREEIQIARRSSYEPKPAQQSPLAEGDA